MAINKQNLRLNALYPSYDVDGSVTELIGTIGYILVDDADNERVPHQRNVNIWAKLTDQQKTQATTALQRFRTAALS